MLLASFIPYPLTPAIDHADDDRWEQHIFACCSEVFLNNVAIAIVSALIIIYIIITTKQTFSYLLCSIKLISDDTRYDSSWHVM